ncbi:MAG: LptF/LptG family permease [Candidatus Omnitrophica bacterium]|nr:LptF/LptG family permease [Candidatus Omnitrophota bacterium]
MHIIRNYLLKEFVGPFLLALLVSTMILTAGNIVQVADMIINKGVSAFYILKLLLFLMPWLLTFTIPISALSATLLAFGRLAGDNEIIALKSSGVSLYRIASPVLVFGFILSLICIPLNDKLLPESGFVARKLIKEIGIRNPLALLEPGVFIKGFEDYIIFIYNINGNKLKNIRIYQPEEGRPTRTIVAEEGEVISMPEKNAIKLKLKNGSADEALPQNPNSFYKMVFKTYYMTLNFKDAMDYNKIEKKPREMTIRELRREIKKLEKDKVETIPLYIEMHNKIALAFSNIVFILIGIPIAIKTHRREKSINFGLAMFLFLAYWGIMLGGVACAIRKFVPPWTGVWMANIILSLVGVYLFLKMAKK